MLTTAGKELVVLKDGAEVTEVKSTTKGNYAVVEVELRPKKDQKSSPTDTSPSLKLWQEKFKHDANTPEVFDYLWINVTAPSATNSPLDCLTRDGEALKVRGGCSITVDLLNKLTRKNGKWFEGKGSSASYYKNTFDTYTNVIGIDKENFLSILKEKISEYQIDKSCYHIAHFLAQIIHESAHFDTTLEYASGTAYGTQHSSAEDMEHTQDSDGPKYLGRGLIQLTWKKNYRQYGKSKGDELKFVNNPDTIGNDMKNAIDASCWYWRNTGAVSQKFNSKGDINILIDNARDDVTLVSQSVNGGRYGHANGLAERKRLYKEIAKAMNLEIGEIL